MRKLLKIKLPWDRESNRPIKSVGGELKFGLLSYGESNLGDDIQALAALQFLPRVDYFVHRDSIGEFTPSAVGEKVKICLNGWFLGSRSWPPARSLDPLLVSFHLGRHHYAEDKRFGGKNFLLQKKSIAYLKQHEPIGCRDLTTVQLLRSQNVAAYFSGCLTLTLTSEHVGGIDSTARDEILFVEPNLDMRTLFSSVPPRLRPKASFVSHQTLLGGPPELRLNTASRMLKRYAAAKLIITSRLHCALPCLAFGTPVLFIPPSHDTGRLSGLVELFNPMNVSDGVITERISWDSPSPNPSKHIAIAEKLVSDCRRFFGPKY
jgi:hypothetical protein